MQFTGKALSFLQSCLCLRFAQDHAVGDIDHGAHFAQRRSIFCVEDIAAVDHMSIRTIGAAVTELIRQELFTVFESCLKMSDDPFTVIRVDALAPPLMFMRTRR